MAKKGTTLRQFVKAGGEIVQGFRDVARDVRRPPEPGSKFEAKRAKKAEAREARPKKVKQGPWLSSRDMRAYRTLVAPTKPTKARITDDNGKKKTVIKPPKEQPAQHTLHWPTEDDLHLRVGIRHARQRKFQLLRFPESEEDIRSLAKWLANMLYDRKTWRNYLLPIEEAIADGLEMGNTVEIPVDEGDYVDDVDQDMS